MDRPQQPEIARSGRTDIDPDHVPDPDPTMPRHRRGREPVPEENRPGHHPEREQDKPELPDPEASETDE